jgi:type II secretory pathway pseudopilin PulG
MPRLLLSRDFPRQTVASHCGSFVDRLLHETPSVMRAANSRTARSEGFSLHEVVVAMSILDVALSALAQLSAASTHANTSARTATFATVLATQKIEQLRALTWGFDAAGQPLSDTTTDVSVVPPRSYEGVGLSPSPAGALERNLTGYCDFLDGNGRSLGCAAVVPDAAIYVRRWSVEPLPSSPNDALVLQVLVARVRDTHGTSRIRPDEARMATLKTRTKS